jgi:cyanophycinase
MGTSAQVAAVGLLLCIGVGADAQAPSRPGAPGATGRLVIVGGALSRDNAEVYDAIFGGRLGEGPLCILPTAGADPAASMASAAEALARYAGETAVVGIPLSLEDPGKANDPAVAAEIGRCSGFFFTGGVQSRVLEVFLPEGDTTTAYRSLLRRWREGAVVAGTSAGAAMMARVMIASGGSAGAIERGVTSAGAPQSEAEGEGEGVTIQEGMGFYGDALLDQHFLARGRIGRLLVAVLATDSVPVGFGIDENTALVVDGDRGRVLGASGVVVVDGRRAARSSPTRGTGIRLALAGTGDVIDLRTLEVARAGEKIPLPVTGGALELPDDPFARWAFLGLLHGLAASSESEASFRLPGAVLFIREAPGFSAAVRSLQGGVEGAPYGFSAGPFLVDLRPGA